MAYIYISDMVHDRIKQNASMLGMTQTALVSLATEVFANLPPTRRHSILAQRTKKVRRTNAKRSSQTDG